MTYLVSPLVEPFLEWQHTTEDPTDEVDRRVEQNCLGITVKGVVQNRKEGSGDQPWRQDDELWNSRVDNGSQEIPMSDSPVS